MLSQLSSKSVCLEMQPVGPMHTIRFTGAEKKPEEANLSGFDVAMKYAWLCQFFGFDDAAV